MNDNPITHGRLAEAKAILRVVEDTMSAESNMGWSNPPLNRIHQALMSRVALLEKEIGS